MGAIGHQSHRHRCTQRKHAFAGQVWHRQHPEGNHDGQSNERIDQTLHQGNGYKIPEYGKYVDHDSTHACNNWRSEASPKRWMRSSTVSFCLACASSSSLMRPAFMAIKRFPYWMACCILWVIIRALSRSSSTMRRVACITSSAVAGSKAAVCSSSKSSCGLRNEAIKSASTCRCPPESLPASTRIRVSSPKPN